MAEVLPAIRRQFTDADGKPLVGGKLYSYEAGSTTPLATYLDRDKTTENTNPIILDAAGEAVIFIDSGVAYKFVLTDADDTEIWSQDEIVGVSPLHDAGTGDVIGPSGSENNSIALFSGTTGKIIKKATGSGIVKLVSNIFTLVSGINLSTETTGTLPINKGGTGQTNAPGAINALLPGQSGNNGKVLTTDGTAASWASVSGVPDGGANGAALVKASATDKDVAWDDFVFSGISRFGAWSSAGLKDTITKILNILYTPPTISLSASGSGTIREKGSAVTSTTLTAAIGKLSDPIAQVRFYLNPSTLLDTQNSGGAIPNGGNSTYNWSGSFSDNTTFRAEVDDNGATGGPTTVSSTATFSFVYPYYVGAGAPGLAAASVAALTKRVIASTANRTETISASGGNVFYFAYPASYGALTSILDVNNFETLPDWTLRTENITGLDGNPVSYRIYEFNNPVTAGSYQYTFKR